MKVFNGYILNKRGNYILDSLYATREVAEAWVEFYSEVYRGKIEESGVEELDVLEVSPEDFVFETCPTTT